MSPLEHAANAVVERFARAARLADCYAIGCIEDQCWPPTDCSTGRWWNTAGMLDSRRHPGEVLDLNADVLAYAIERRLVQMDPCRPQWVRIVRQPEPAPRYITNG